MDRQFQQQRQTDRQTDGQRRTQSLFWELGVGRYGFCEIREVLRLPLSVGAVLAGGVGVHGRPVRLLAVFARWHPLVYPVQASGLFEVANLPRGRETLNGWRTDSGRGENKN